MLRPVTVRARRIAAITASEPVLQKVARSMPVISQMSAATSPRERRLRTDLHALVELLGLTASVTKCGRMPEEVQAEAHERSTYSLPSTSQSFEPEERSATIG